METETLTSPEAVTKTEEKKLFIKTFGCQMNFYDSERMQDVLSPMGFAASETPEGADLVILNTCHIREKATEKVYSDLGRIRKEKERMAKDGKRMLIAVAGCTAQAEGAEIMRRAPYVDMVVGPQSYQRLPQMIQHAQAALQNTKSGVMELDFASVEKFDELPVNRTDVGSAAFLTIQEGCDKFCHFCVVPYTRGAEFSRPVTHVYREALQLVEKGAVELTLLGQNVNAYHGESPLVKGESWSLGKLMQHLAEIPGLQRIRYTTSHPRDVDDELIFAHRDNPKIMPYVHLPVQSGSDRILAAMNRKHTAAEYLDIIARFRAATPGIEFSSDFIVGFPGETEEDFQDTLALVRAARFTQAYSFAYSPRPGTPAATREDSVPEDVKLDRLHRLQALVNKLQLEYNQRTVGDVVQVLLEKKGRGDGQLTGRSPTMQAVTVTCGDEHLGQIVPIRITSAHANGVKGEVLA